MNRTLAIAVVFVIAVTAIAAAMVLTQSEESDTGSIVYNDGRPFGDSVTLPDGTVEQCQFTRDMFAFTGWNTNADGSGATYMPGDSLDLTSGSLTLYAQWAPLMSTTVWQSGTEDLIGSVVLVTEDGETEADNGTVVEMGDGVFMAYPLCTGWQTDGDGTFVDTDGNSVEIRFVGSVIFRESYVDGDGSLVCEVEVGGPFGINILLGTA